MVRPRRWIALALTPALLLGCASDPFASKPLVPVEFDHSGFPERKLSEAPDLDQPAEPTPTVDPPIHNRFRERATFDQPRIALELAAAARTNSDRVAAPSDKRFCFPGSEVALLGQFRFEATFLPDVIAYRIVRVPVHMNTEHIVTSGTLLYERDDSHSHDAEYEVPLLAARYSFRASVREISLSTGYTIGVEFQLTVHGSDPETELARIAMRESGQAFEFRGLSEQLDALNRAAESRHSIQEGVRIYQGVSLVLNVVPFFTNPAAAFTVRSIAKKVMASILDDAVVGSIARKSTTGSDLDPSTLVLRRVNLSCYYCERPFVVPEISTGGSIQCPTCGTGVKIHYSLDR